MSAAFALLSRELRLALRSGGGAGLGLAFFLIVVMLIPFGVGPVPTLLAKSHPERCGLPHFSPACYLSTAYSKRIMRTAH